VVFCAGKRITLRDLPATVRDYRVGGRAPPLLTQGI